MQYNEFKIKKKKTRNTRTIKLIVPAGSATVSSALGPILGQFGINTIEFCNQFNERTWFISEGLLLLVELIYIPSKKEFFFDIKGPLTSVLLFECLDTQTKQMDKKKLYKAALIRLQNKAILFNFCKN